MGKFLIVMILFAGIFGIFYAYMYVMNQQEQKVVVSSFTECSKYYPVMESYPARCRTDDGKSFIQEIGNEERYINEIQVENPRPNQVIADTLEVKGKARGPWFFEANFSAELFDGNKRRIGNGIMSAEGEWMTEEFVPFSGIIELDAEPSTEVGVLYIRNANPSGLKENDKELVIPVTLVYEETSQE